MATNTTFRVPNLPIGPITDKDGNPTANEQMFRQGLIDLLQSYLGQEGIVAPSQSEANVQVIKNATNINGVATMLPGTIIYQEAAAFADDKLIVAFRSSLTPGAVPTLYYVNVTVL